MYDDDAVLTSPMAARWFARADGTLRGKHEVRDYVAAGLDCAPDLHLEPQHTLVGVDGVTVLYMRETGALVAEMMLLTEVGTVRRARIFYHGLKLTQWPPD
jgi:hypothetical protein